MAQAEKMAKTAVRMASARRSGKLLKAEFKRKFGHSYDRLGYHGHPFFGHNCYGCGIHISRITANKGLREQLELDVGDAKNGERDTVKLRTPGKPTAQEPPATLPESFFRIPRAAFIAIGRD